MTKIEFYLSSVNCNIFLMALGECAKRIVTREAAGRRLCTVHCNNLLDQAQAVRGDLDLRRRTSGV